MRKKQFEPSFTEPVLKVSERQKAKEWASFWDANHTIALIAYGLSEEQVKTIWLEAYADSDRRPTWHDLSPKLAFDKPS